MSNPYSFKVTYPFKSLLFYTQNKAFQNNLGSNQKENLIFINLTSKESNKSYKIVEMATVIESVNKK